SASRIARTSSSFSKAATSAAALPALAMRGVPLHPAKRSLQKLFSLDGLHSWQTPVRAQSLGVSAPGEAIAVHKARPPPRAPEQRASDRLQPLGHHFGVRKVEAQKPLDDGQVQVPIA